MTELRYVNPRDLHDYWQTIKPGVAIVQPLGNGWIAEDVYTAIRAGTSTLHVGFKDGRYVGFLVLTPTVNPWTNKRELEVWIAYSEDEESFEAGMEEVQRCADHYGAERIYLLSPRRGWERKLQPYGFKPGLMRFER